MGTIDVTSGAIPARAQEVLPTENAAGVLFNGARAYKRQTRRWRPGAPEPISDAFAMRTANLKAAELDVRRMRLPEFGTIDATVAAAHRAHAAAAGQLRRRHDGHSATARRSAAVTDGTTLTRDAAGRHLAPARHPARRRSP